MIRQAISGNGVIECLQGQGFTVDQQAVHIEQDSVDLREIRLYVCVRDIYDPF